MIETLEPEFAQIWLRRSKFFWSLFLSVSQSQVRRNEKREQEFFGRLIHIWSSLGQGVSVISVSAEHLASHSYRYRLASPYIINSISMSHVTYGEAVSILKLSETLGSAIDHIGTRSGNETWALIWALSFDLSLESMPLASKFYNRRNQKCL